MLVNMMKKMCLSNVEPMPLYPTMDSLKEVIAYANSNIPVESKNLMYVLMAIYHNTLLKEINESNS